LVEAPTYQKDGMVLGHPGVPCLVHASLIFAFTFVDVGGKLNKGTVSEEVLNFLSAHVGDGLGIKLRGLLEFSDSFDAVLAQNSLFVSMEHSICLEFYRNWSISQKFLLDVFGSDLTKTESSDLSCCTNFGNWFTFIKFGARLALG
jgi:hypothetical protein